MHIFMLCVWNAYLTFVYLFMYFDWTCSPLPRDKALLIIQIYLFYISNWTQVLFFKLFISYFGISFSLPSTVFTFFYNFYLCKMKLTFSSLGKSLFYQQCACVWSVSNCFMCSLVSCVCILHISSLHIVWLQVFFVFAGFECSVYIDFVYR